MNDKKKRMMKESLLVALMVLFAGCAEADAMTMVTDETARTAGLAELTQSETGIFSFTADQATMGRLGQAAMTSTAMMWRANSDAMTNRMGEVRAENGEIGLWMKYHKGKMETGEHMSKFKNSYKAYQLGYDGQVSNRWLVGTALSFYDGTSDYERGGEGKNDVISLSVYGVRKAAGGTYWNLAGSVSYLDNMIDVYHESDDKFSSDHQTWGASVSAQYGKRFEATSGFYFDPSIQIMVGRIQGKNYKAIGGDTRALYSDLRLNQDDTDSMIGRIGFSLGQKMKRVNYFTKFSLAKELDSDLSTDFFADGEHRGSTSMDFRSTWYELELGGGLQLGEQTTLYATYEHSFGGDIKEKYRLDGGVKISF